MNWFARLTAAVAASWPLLALWAPAVAATLAARAATLDEHGHALLAASLGRAITASQPVLSAWERWSFCRGDLLWTTLVAPAAILILRRFARPALSAAVVALATVAVLALTYTETEFYREVGRFQSIELIVDGVLWGSDNPDLAGQFLPTVRLSVVGVAVVAVFAGAYLAARQMGLPATSAATDAMQRGSPTKLTAIVAAALVAVLAVNLSAWCVPIETTAWHKSLYRRYLEDYCDAATWDEAEFADYGAAALAAEFRRRTNTPPPRRDTTLFAAAADCDVLLFVMETGPAACLEIDPTLADMPNLARLRQRAFVAARHMTTYPYTSRAVFSLLSSWYPSSAALDFIEQVPRLAAPGLVRALAERGYESTVYLPLPLSFRSDERMFRSLGFAEIYVAPRVAGEPGEPPWRICARHDEAALAAWKDDLERRLRAGRRSVTLFLPQVGHAPWPDISEGENVRDNLRRGRAIMALQDRWLGEVIEVLERHGRLERSLIVVTADHGLRNASEDPLLRMGEQTDRMFRVPLVVYAPQALGQTHAIEHLTSHVDVAPTLLDLLGVQRETASASRGSEQGLPIWDERLAGRTVFLWGRHYTGCDGFAWADGFATWNHELDITARSKALPPEPADVLRRGSAADREVRDMLDRMAALQHAWVRQNQVMNDD